MGVAAAGVVVAAAVAVSGVDWVAFSEAVAFEVVFAEIFVVVFDTIDAKDTKSQKFYWFQ